jgi:hypothetical protein
MVIYIRWNHIVAGVSIICFASGLTIGLYTPRALTVDIFLNYILLITILISTILGIFLIGRGLAKD